jgi:arylsulfatase A-like enzyme
MTSPKRDGENKSSGMGRRPGSVSGLTRRKFLKYGLYSGLAAGLQSSLWLTGCTRSKSSSTRPNILWIVWDTVRADHLSLYGYSKPTTPFLDNWAQKVHIFDNCTSVSNSTTPTHVSMFTGLMPGEHGRNNTENYIGNAFTTVAELLYDRGYQTYLHSANPLISRERNFTQGFDIAEHPWDAKYESEALRIFLSKLDPRDRSTEHLIAFNSFSLPFSGALPGQMFTTCGQLAQRGVEGWLKNCDRNRPFFIFINYMEAHQPYVPPESYRKRLMDPDQVNKSYSVDRSQLAKWSYTFGLKEYTDEEIELTKLTYDATLIELDDLLRDLITSLDVNGYMDNTIVILTSDHGEHLGDHHMLDHLYSVYESLIRVPLIIHYPKCFSPGRDKRPVTNLDLFPTVLELAGVEMPRGLQSKAVSLLRPQEQRLRMAECPAFTTQQFGIIKRFYPDFDPTPWSRTLRAVYHGKHKLIWASDGRYELYDLATDQDELKNLITIKSELAEKLAKIHDDWVVSFEPSKRGSLRDRPLTDEERRRLESLGYIGSRRE